MLYASTKATFKKQFGAGQIKEDYYANHREEVWNQIVGTEASSGCCSLMLKPWRVETELWCILMSALTLIKALCLVLYFQVTLAGYKKFLAVEVISGFLTWHQSFHLTFVTLPFPGCPWAPESSWRGAKSHQRSRSKDWGDTWWIFSRVFFCTFREGTSEQHHPGYHEFMFHQVSVDSKHNTLSGLAFPLQPEATDAIREYSQGTKDYVQLAIGE